VQLQEHFTSFNKHDKCSVPHWKNWFLIRILELAQPYFEYRNTNFMKLINCLTLSIIFLFCQCNASAESLAGQVVGVSDGDTITLIDSTKNQHKIRLTGIDAPEKSQAFGQASKKSLSDMVFNQYVVVSWEKRDRYKRILGKVLLKDQDVCLEQVKRGMAWHYKKYERDQNPEDRAAYALAEKKARDIRLGLWADEAPIEPAQFRHKK